MRDKNRNILLFILTGRYAQLVFIFLKKDSCPPKKVMDTVRTELATINQLNPQSIQHKVPIKH